MKETAIRLREFAEDWANTPIDTDVDIRRLNVSLFLDQLMRIIDDGYMSNELVNQEVERRIAEIVREAWFEGMKQGITFTREDRDRELRASKRMTFDEWLRSRLLLEQDQEKDK